MASFIFPTHLLATGGLVFAFENSTFAGKAVLFTLFFGSIFSWSVMITKIRLLHFAKRQARHFLELFRTDRQPLRIYETQCASMGRRFSACTKRAAAS